MTTHRHSTIILPMHLETNRLILRVLQSPDTEAYFKLSQNDGFQMFQISNYRKSSHEEALQWIQKIEAYHQRNKLGILGVFKKNTKELIGLCALKYLNGEGESPVELMYRLNDLHWGLGYGYEISQTLVQYAFSSTPLKSLVATVDAKNIPSKRILEKLGFKFERIVEIESFEEELHVLLKS
ncbi:MAG: GNAT family N-acetyltransferase [Pseudobdellovibrionaceae bacterium]